jgi:hypothetical protein
MVLGQYILIVSPAGSCSSTGTGIGTLVTLTHEGADWVARSETLNDGNVELRFHELTDGSTNGVAVAGYLVGIGYEIRVGFTSEGGTVSSSRDATGGVAQVSAQTVPLALNELAGSATGRIVFSSTSGTVTCPSADIVLRQPIPCELVAGVPCGL